MNALKDKDQACWAGRRGWGFWKVQAATLVGSSVGSIVGAVL